MYEGPSAVLAEALAAVGILLLEGDLPRPFACHDGAAAHDPHVVPVAVGGLAAVCEERKR